MGANPVSGPLPGIREPDEREKKPLTLPSRRVVGIKQPARAPRHIRAIDPLGKPHN